MFFQRKKKQFPSFMLQNIQKKNIVQQTNARNR